MSVGSFAQSELNTSVTAKVSGTFTAANFLTIANDSVKEVIAELDLHGTIRSAALSPNLFDGVWDYTCPTDLKDDKIIDIKPQINRGRHDYWRLVTAEEFDQIKEDNRVDQWGDPITLNRGSWLGDNIVAINRDDLVNRLLISRVIDDTETSISTMDSLTAGGGTWTLYGDGTNLTADTQNYVKGNGSINWDISDAGGTTAGIYNPSISSYTNVGSLPTLPNGSYPVGTYVFLTTNSTAYKNVGEVWCVVTALNVDVSPYLSAGSALAWAYISSATNLTNFILRIGSSDSAYYSITITTNNEAASFYAGWNLLRFDFANKSTTGTPVPTSCNYVALYMTKAAAKVSETDYRFDNLILKLGTHQQVVYYTRYGWQSSAGVFLEDATATTDLLNCETSEYPIIVAKTAQRIAEHLKNFNEADRFEKDYEKLKARYIPNNPSKALPLIQTYYDL